MTSTFVREQKRYTQNDLCEIFQCSREKAIPIIRKLKEYGVLKVVSAIQGQRDMSDLADEDIEIMDVVADENRYFYVFTFVGVIIIEGKVLKCYPKYILQNDSPKEELQQILKVLEKYNSQEQIIRMFNESSENSSFNLLAVLMFLLNDYYENGIYNNTSEIIESNGLGEILWDKTINETFAFLINNRPYYIDLQTKKRVDDEYDFFRRLHECILTEASVELADADLLDLFEITEVHLSDENISDFGEIDYILYRIENELNMQFNTRKQLVLKTIYAYLSHNGTLSDTDALSLLGTNSFNLVWEKVCADILDNQLNTPLVNLHLPTPLKNGYEHGQKLIDIIEKPYWSATDNHATDTLIPDIVSICESQFAIFDAKYYNAVLEPGYPPKSQPGIESVTKQYLYQLAYNNFIEDHEFTSIKNCFLLPTEQGEVIDKGYVSMEFFAEYGLENIQVRLLPAKVAYSYYLSGQKMDTSELGL